MGGIFREAELWVYDVMKCGLSKCTVIALELQQTLCGDSVSYKF
jgi:hypothetical protein